MTPENLAHHQIQRLAGEGPEHNTSGARTADEDSGLPPFLTPKEAASRLRVSIWAIYDAVAAETLPAVRVGRSIRIPRHAVVVEDRTLDGAEA